MADGYLALISRIHAGFNANRRLATLLDGRLVAVLGATAAEWAELEPHLASCGADVVADLGPDVAAVIAGSAVTEDDLVAAAVMDVAVLRPADVALLVHARRKVAEQDGRLYDEALERVRNEGRLMAATRERRARETVEQPTSERGMHIREL